MWFLNLTLFTCDSTGLHDITPQTLPNVWLQLHYHILAGFHPMIYLWLDHNASYTTRLPRINKTLSHSALACRQSGDCRHFERYSLEQFV